MAEDFVEGIVASDVFAQDDQITFKIKEGAGVEAAGLGEGVLCLSQLVGQVADDAGGNLPVGGDGREDLEDGVNGGFAAEAAAAAGEDVSGEVIPVDGGIVGKEGFDDVAFAFAFSVAWTDGEFEEVGGLFDDALGEEEAGGEVFVVTGGAHDDGKSAAFETQFKGFFGSDPIGFGGVMLVVEETIYGDGDGG